MRIDGHVHGDPTKTNDPKGYVAMCRDHGIEAAVLIEPLETCLRAVERFGEFIIPVARITMDRDGVSDVERAIGAGCKGIKFIRPAAPYADRRYWPFYEALEAMGAVAVFHTGYLGFRSREDNPVRIEDMRAAQVDVIARRFCDLKILMAHYSNPWWEEAWKVSYANKNVYVDLSGGTARYRAIDFWAQTFAPDGQIHQPSLRKLCFASDRRYFDDQAGATWQAHADFYDRLLARITPSAELVETINRGNARALFGLA